MGSTRNWRRAIGSGTLAVALASLSGCGAPIPAPVLLRICTFPTQDFLPYFVMQERGLDRAHGLRFEETAYPGGAAAIQAMATGSLDVCPAVGVVPMLVAHEQGLIPDKIIPVAANNFTDRDHPAIGVVVAKSVQSWRDLRGVKIAINARNSVSTAAVVGRLKQEGVEGYSLVEIGFANMGLAVAGGNVAAAGMYEPTLTQSLLRGDGKLLGWVAGGPPLEEAPMTMIVFAGELRRRNPGAVKAFLRAHLEATRWMRENPDRTRAILARHLQLTAEVARGVNLLRWPADARNNRAMIERLQPLLVEIGMLQRPVPTDRLYDESPLNEVLAETR